MLLELRIENLLLIERAELRFGGGLNAITGETGAGKTVLAHSLDLLLGGRARPQIVRPGAGEAWVEGVFSLPEGLLDEPALAEIAARLPAGADEVALGRRIGASGRTSAFIAGRSAAAADLTALGSRLVSFFGQHEHRRLALGSAQLEILDGSAGSEHLAVRGRYRSAHRRAAAIEHELAELRERQGSRERDLDLLRFELAEIDEASPDAERVAEMHAEREQLRHAEALRAAAGGASIALSGDADSDAGAIALLAGGGSALDGVEGIDPELDALAERLRAASVELSDLAGELRGLAEHVEAEPGRLEGLDERLAALERLRRKH
nr:AAA family ATPase [Solirubrobacterales bacterium]